jgi:hypothetical protein
VAAPWRRQGKSLRSTRMAEPGPARYAGRASLVRRHRADASRSRSCGGHVLVACSVVIGSAAARPTGIEHDISKRSGKGRHRAQPNHRVRNPGWPCRGSRRSSAI